MARPRTNRERLFAFCLALGFGLNLVLSQGCARSEPVHPSEASSPASQQKLPFHSESDQAPDSEGGLLAVGPAAKQATSSPFQAASPSRILPAGTLLTVQLQDSLPIANVRAGDIFMASVAAPITINRDILLERGTAVTGGVEAAQSPATSSAQASDSGHPTPGYVRLTLRAVTLEGRQLALQTSSLFARGALQPEGVAVQKGRRLTFRLMAPVTLDDQNSVANRQSSRSSTE